MKPPGQHTRRADGTSKAFGISRRQFLQTTAAGLATSVITVVPLYLANCNSGIVGSLKAAL